MIRKWAAGLIVAGAVLGAGPVYASAASAGTSTVAEQSLLQLVHSRQHYLSPHDVRRILRHQGYHEIRILGRHDRTYRVAAENYRGRDVILRVSARTGAVVSVRTLGERRRDGWGHYDRQGPGHGGWHGGRYGPRPWPSDDRPRCWLPEGCY